MKKLSAGMVKDAAPVDQAEGTMRDALNVNLNLQKGSVVNEFGTYEYPANRGFKTIGSVTTDDDVVILFGLLKTISPVVGVAPVYTHQIRYLNPKNQSVIVLYENDNLNFRETHPIVAEFRKNQANETLVYFTDGYTETDSPYPGFEYVSVANPPRVLNVSQQLKWRFGGGPETELYNPANSFHKLQLFPRVGSHSTFGGVTITTGGVIVTAAYYLALAYADETGLETNYFAMSNPVYITDGAENALPSSSFIGAQGGSATNKAINWEVIVPGDVEYDLLQPVVVQLINETKTFYKLPPVQINLGGKINVQYSGSEKVEIINDQDVVVDEVHYKSASTLSQLDNRLYLGNVTSTKDIGFQPFAHNIQLTAATKTVDQFNPRYYDTFVLNQGYAQMVQTFDAEGGIGRSYVKKYNYLSPQPFLGYVAESPTVVLSKNYYDILNDFFNDSTNNFATKKGYRDTRYSYKLKSYRRSEVYAFYMSFVLKDGTETYAYHIPGRTASAISGGTDTAYEAVHYKKITFEVKGSSATKAWAVVFAYLPQSTIDASTWDSSSPNQYTEGIYRAISMGDSGAYEDNADDALVDAFDQQSLPCTQSIPDPNSSGADGFITADTSAGGAFGQDYLGGSVTNELEIWLLANIADVPASTGVVGGKFKSILEEVDMEVCVNNGIDLQTPGLLQSEHEVSAPEVNENDLFEEHESETNRIQTGYKPDELVAQDRTLRIYQAVNTSDINNDASNMGFWENVNEFYPNTQDFLKGVVGADGSVTVDQADTMAGENVRHHRFPHNNHPGLGYIERQSDGSVSKQPEEAYKVNGGGLSTAQQLDQNGAIIVSERARMLGFKLSQIKLPKYILSQVKGFKLYYAKRKPENKTILGQSLAIPAHIRYASVPQQSLALAVQGPFKKAFYMYGGLDHTNNSSIDMYGTWRQEEYQRYWGQPVFKFHDFNMLRKQYSLAAATHVDAQFGIIFRMWQGGPGKFVKPCSYADLRDVPESGGGYTNDDGTLAQNSVAYKDQASTVFNSMGWVSPDMKNTDDFYYHDPAHVGNISNFEDTLVGVNRVLDISDTFDLDIADVNEEIKKGKRSRMIRRGDDLREPIADTDDETIVAREAKKARVRAWYTSVMIGTVYMSPSAVLKGFSFTKGGDYKGNNNYPSRWLSRFWGGDIQDQGCRWALEPDGYTYLPGRTLFETSNSSSFKGVSYLYNEAGESCIALSLVSGLPTLRGHIGRYDGSWRYVDGKLHGLQRWGEANRWLYPDAAIEGVPTTYQQYGNSMSEASFLVGSEPNGKYDPATFRGLKYSLEHSDNLFGMPMAWLVNLCATKTDVFNPFDQQQLVWTGFYQEINDANLANGAASDQAGNVTNYYLGADTTAGDESGKVFGGDTYITKHSFRSTSQSYGHSYFRYATDLSDGGASTFYDDYQDTLFPFMDTAVTTNRKRFQGDLPAQLNPAKHSSSGNRFGTTNSDTPVWNWNKEKLLNLGWSDGAYEGALKSLEVIRDTWNWVKGNVNPVSTLFQVTVESDDLIEFSHVVDSEKGIKTQVFDHDSASSYLFKPPTEDYTKADNMLYSEHYSALQDIKVAVPLPAVGELADVDTFPRRVVRSDVDSGSLADGFRKFRALEFKDIPSQRGDIQNLYVNRGVLYIHTDRSLFMTRGKEEMQLSAVTAFIGSGDIFTQDPDEVQESTIGHGGTTSRHCHVTTQHGHFYINYKDRAFYNAGPNGIETIGKGMDTWLRENIPFALEYYGIDLASPGAEANGFYVDAPTAENVPLGFTMGYDPRFKRILITKHEPVPTAEFITQFNAGNITIIDNIPHLIGDDCVEFVNEEDDNPEADPGARDLESQRDGSKKEVFCGPIWFGNPTYFTQGGWTLSYYPEYGVFGSRHSYRPNLYAYNSQHLLSFTNEGQHDVSGAGTDLAISSWEHSNDRNPGQFYGKRYNFEVEYIDNTARNEAKLYSSIYYYAESMAPDDIHAGQVSKVTNPVFTSFYVYNSTQVSGTGETINYLHNARLIDRTWYINDFRDMAKQETITEGVLINGQENVAGYITSEVTSNPQSTTMFTEEGVVNSEYVEANKEWYNRRKFVDHYLGVRLIGDNSNRNLVHLYAVGTKFRKSYR